MVRTWVLAPKNLSHVFENPLFPSDGRNGAAGRLPFEIERRHFLQRLFLKVGFFHVALFLVWLLLLQALFLFLVLLLFLQELQFEQQSFGWIVCLGRFLVLRATSIAPGKPDVL